MIRFSLVALVAAAGCVLQPSTVLLPEGPAPSCRAAVPADGRVDLAWAGPDHARDRARLDEWCTAVGPPVVELTPASLDRAVERIALVSWNAGLGRGDLAALVKELQAGALTGDGLSQFVLILQEMYRLGVDVPPDPGDRRRHPRALGLPHAAESRDVRALARSLGLAVAYVPSMRNGPGRADRGNAILSTLPLDDLMAIELPFEHQRRVAVSAIVRGYSPSGRKFGLRVVSAHLDTTGALARGGPSAARRRQARALVSALDATGAPALVGADLNTSWGEDEPAFTELRGAFPDAVSVVRGPTWRGPLGIQARLDHMFARTGTRVEVWRVDRRFGSDHHPLVAMLEPGDLIIGSSDQSGASRTPISPITR
jgi:endonuclease/exonuclease/phosphatase family metal-dependent hydrolase